MKKYKLGMIVFITNFIFPFHGDAVYQTILSLYVMQLKYSSLYDRNIFS